MTCRLDKCIKRKFLVNDYATFLFPSILFHDIKIIIEAPKEPDTATKEIVNKTVRVDGEEQPSGTGAGIDQLLDCFQNLTPKCPPASPTKLVPLPTPHKEIPISTTTDTFPGDIANTGENPPSPTTEIQPEKCEVNTTDLTQEEPPPINTKTDIQPEHNDGC